MLALMELQKDCEDVVVRVSRPMPFGFGLTLAAQVAWKAPEVAITEHRGLPSQIGAAGALWLLIELSAAIVPGMSR